MDYGGLTMRNEKIDRIIQRRKPMSERITNVKEHLTQTLDQFVRFRSLCRTVLQNRDAAAEFDELNRIIETSNQSVQEGQELRDNLTSIQNRLLRNTLNIAVIGRARQGKSRLLQTITGLSCEEIPDGNQAFCTGVRSDIINDITAEKAYAIVNFLTEERFIDENIAPYFSDLQRYKPELFTPMSISEFKSFILPEPGSFKASPEDTTQMNLHLQHLKDLQAHLSQYYEYLGKPPLRITKEQIREYVAQDNAEGERIYFKHMAVDSVEIFCKFPNSDVGALRLIDLPGLGDTRIGDVERVVRALRDQVDLVLFLSKPSNSGAGWQDNEVHLYSQARRALGEKLPIERWAFWVFNHDSRPGADNNTQCELLKNSMKAAQISVADTVIVDCTNIEEVSEKLIDKALDHLENNIERNDREYAENIQSALANTMQKIRDVLYQAQNFLKDDGSFDDRDSGIFDTLFEELWDELCEELQACVEEGSELRQNRENPCLPLQERIESILDEEENNNLDISEDAFKKAARRLGGIGSAYEDYLHQLRTGLSHKMQQNLDDILDNVLAETKDKLCEILGVNGKLEKRFGVHDHSLLDELINFVDTSGYKDDVPTLIEGFSLVNDWTMSYRSFIQHRIRNSLNALDPLDRECLAMGSPNSEIQACENLRELYKQSIYTLRKEFDGIYSEPNKAAFAIAEEFKDIMIRPHDTKGNGPRLINQWRKIYRSIKGDIWPEEYGNSQLRRDVCSKLRVPLMTLITFCEPEKFNFLN